MELTVNKNNWTGETIKVKINKKEKRFTLYGYEFKIEKKDHGIFHLIGSDWKSKLVTIFETDGWYQTYGGPVHLESKNLFETAIQYLCNVL